LLNILHSTDVPVSNLDAVETSNESHHFISYLCKKRKPLWTGW
jgi:hypothetical protein